MELKERLKQKRTEAGYTQKELAEILHVSRQTISSWEVGRTYPDLELLIAISDLYETPLDDLLKEDSRIVEDITSKVKRSERRKIINVILAILLIVVVGYGLNSSYQRYQNNLANEEDLSPSDLLNTGWQMNYDPNNELVTSRVSFSENDLLMLNEYMPIGPFMNPARIKKKQQEFDEKGLADGMTEYKDLKIKVEGNKYILTAYGYKQEFTKLSDTIIRDENGTEYYKLQDTSMHKIIYHIAEQMGVSLNE